MSEIEANIASEIGRPKTGVHYSRAYLNYVLILLLVVGIFNFVDRQIMAILLEPITEKVTDLLFQEDNKSQLET